jgi:alcohol dehydrogenase class IV
MATSFETVFPACKVIFGAGASGRAGAEAAALGAHRVLFVCSPSLLATPQATSVRKSLGGRLVVELNDVRAHVPSDLVPAGRLAATPT